MKKIFFLFVIFQFSFCFAAKTPSWINNVDIEFPKSKYIARLGTGNTAENARSDALGQLALFFKSQVLVNTNASSMIQSDGEKSYKNQQIDQNVKIASDVTLTTVEYTLPHYDKKQKSYFVVAYIEKKSGYQSVEPKIMQERSRYDSFMELSKKAETSLLKYKYLMKAKDAGDDLISALYMGYLFDSEKKKDYRNFISEFSQNVEIETLDSFKIPIRVISIGDYENALTSKVVEAFKSKSFTPYFERKNSSDSILKIEIKSNEKVLDEIHTIYPEVSISILSGDEKSSFYTYQKSWGKTANFSLKQAQKKAFSKIGEEIKSLIISDYEEKFLKK